MKSHYLNKLAGMVIFINMITIVSLSQTVRPFSQEKLSLSQHSLKNAKLTTDDFSGTALGFHGTSGYLDIPSDPALNNSQFTVEFWIKTNNPGEFKGVVDKGRSTDSDWYFLTGSAANPNGIIFGVGDGTSRAELSHAWNDTLWHHVAGTFDGTTMHLYVDGQVCGSATTTHSATTNNITIGARNDQSYYLDSKLDEVAIWSLARSATEIRQSLHLTHESTETGLVSYWQFNEGSGTTAADDAGSNDGTLINPAGISWINSTIPLGDGANAILEVEPVLGTVSFPGTGFEMDFSQKYLTDTISVTRIDDSPNHLPEGINKVFDQQYWSIEKYGPGSFTARYIFTTSEKITNQESLNPDMLKLYHRSSTSSGDWTFLASAISVDRVNQKVTFPGFSIPGQFIICTETNYFEGGYINHDTIWSGNMAVNGDVIIDGGVSLTIEPGTRIEFLDFYHIDCRGDIQALGTATDSIVFLPNDTDVGWNRIFYLDTDPANDSSRFSYCHFTHGKAVWDPNPQLRQGGALCIYWFGKISISHCLFTFNSAEQTGGAIFTELSDICVKSSRFYENEANNLGGAIYSQNCDPEIRNCIFEENDQNALGFSDASPYVVNNLIYNNRVSEALYFKNSSGVFINNTIVDNYSGGLILLENSNPQFKNTILRGNAPEVYLLYDSADPDFYYCNVEGGTEDFDGGGADDYTGDFENCIDVGPSFIGTGAHPYDLADDSPCINAGDPVTTTAETGSLDLAGDIRIYQGRVDIGTYESRVPTDNLVGSALEFDGVDDYVAIPSNSLYNSNSFSVEFWIKLNSPAKWSGIIDKGRDSNTDWYFLTGDEGETEGVIFGAGNGSSTAEVSYSWSDELWHHVAGVSNGSAITLYVDGEEKDTENIAVSMSDNAIVLGSRLDNSYFMNGQIDEFTIWNRALGTTEIREMMHKTHSETENGLVGYWSFNSGSGTTAEDKIVTNNGTLMNMNDEDWIISTAPVPYESAADGNWTNPASWLSGQGIPSTSWTRATVNSNLHLNDNRECIELLIETGKSLTIDAGVWLTVTDSLSNLSGTSGLLIKSDATATASLIHENTGVNATVEQYIPQYAGNAGWHFLSSPVSGQAIRPEFVSGENPIPGNDDFYKFDEVTNYWINTKNNEGNWNTAFEDDFVVGRGYNVAYEADVTKSFAGELNCIDLILDETTTPTITYNIDGGAGWNLMGNPYPSGLDWDDCEKTHIDASVYVYKGDVGQYVSWNGSIGSLTDGIIPPMNGFFVKASSNPELTLLNSARVHSSSNFYKEKNNVEDLLVLKVEGNGFSDQTYIHFNGIATNDFDSDFDAYKLMGVSNAPQLYTKAGDSKLSINVLPYTSEEITIPLALEVGNDTEYTISVIENTFRESLDILLKDLESGVVYNLRTNKQLTINQSTSNPDRFLLLINGITGIEENLDVDGIEIYSYGNQVFIKADDPGEVRVYNLLGQQVLHRNLLDPGNLTGFPIQATGIYLTTVKTGKALSTKKVFIR